MKSPIVKPRLPRNAIWLICALILCAFAIGKGLSWSAAGATLAVTGYGAAVAYLCRQSLNRHVQILHWLLIVAGSVVLSGYFDWNWDGGPSLGVLTTVIGADLGIVGSAIASRRDGDAAKR